MVDYSSYPMDAYAWADPDIDLENPRFVISVEWTWPAGDWSRFSVVRSIRSPATRREEGQVMMETIGRTWDHFAYQTTGLPVYRDPQPPPGEWVYYTAFVLDPNRVWQRTGFVLEASIADYDWALRLPEILPGVSIADTTRTASPAYGSNDLVQFLQSPGALLDKVVTMGEAAQFFWDPLRVPPQMLQSMTESLGYTYDEALGSGRFRAVIDALMGPQQGSLSSIRNFAEGATGCDSRVEISNNLMIDVNDSSFESGTLADSKWVPAANLELRKYEDWGSSVPAGSDPTLHPNVLINWYLYLKAAGTYTCGPNYVGDAPNAAVVQQGIPVAEWTRARMGFHSYKPSTTTASIYSGLRLYDYLGGYLKQITLVGTRYLTQQWTWYQSAVGSGTIPLSVAASSDLLKSAIWRVDAEYARSGYLMDLSGNGRNLIYGAGATPLALGHSTGGNYVYFAVRTDSVAETLNTAVRAVSVSTMQVTIVGTITPRAAMNTQFFQVGDGATGWVMYLTSAGLVGSRRFNAPTALVLSNVAISKSRNRFTHTSTTGNTVWEHSDDGVTWTTAYTFAHGVSGVSTRSDAGLGAGSAAFAAAGTRYTADVTLDGVLVHQMNASNAKAPYTTIPNTGSAGGNWTITRAPSGLKVTVVDRPLMLFGGTQYMKLAEAFPTSKAVTYLFSYRRYGTPAGNETIYDTGRSTGFPPSDKSGVITQQRIDGTLLFNVRVAPGGVGATSGYFEPAPTPTVITTAIRVEPDGQNTMFVNGVQTFTDGLTGWTGAMANPLLVGGQYTPTDVPSAGATMAFAAAAVWDRALSNEEIAVATTDLNARTDPGFAYAVPFLTVSNPCSVDLIVVDDG